MRLLCILAAWAGALVAVLLAFDASASGDAQQRGKSPPFSTSTAAVLVDVVVRDKLGQPVRGLGAEDFELYEEGARQRITSFAVVNRSEGHSQTANPLLAPDSAFPEPSDPTVPAVFALVFEQLSPHGRQLAYKAASAFLDTNLGPADFVGVFAVDRALHVLVPYSSSAATVRQGVSDASRRPGYPIERAAQVPGAEFASAEPGQPSQATKDDSPYFRAHATFNALDRVIASMRALPGRKAVILFSEGFALGASKENVVTPGGRGRDGDHWLSDNRYRRFMQTIERANRAQVAFYTFDAAGLRVESPLVDACFGCPPYVGLQFLAHETGGAFIENTNDLVPGIKRAAADLRHYYLLAYTSTNAKLDDKYRRIDVKVRRRGVTVLARKGYRASREPEAAHVRGHEVGPLLALENPNPRNGFPLHIGSVPLLTRPGEIGRTAILARVPTSGVPNIADAEAAFNERQLVLLARIKNAAAVPLAYGSEVFDIASDREGSGEVFFYKEVELPVGTHILEVAAYDARSGTATVRRADIEVQAVATSALQLGSLMIGRSAERIGRTSGEQLTISAPQFGNWLLVPNLGEPVAPSTALSFAFAAYVAPPHDEHLQATVAILEEGQQVASWPLVLEAPADGRVIEYLGHVVLPALKAGSYRLMVTLSRHQSSVSRHALFRIESNH